MIRYGLLSANIVLLVSVISFVVQSPVTESSKQNALDASSSNAPMASPLDQLSAADIAVHVAHLVKLQETRSVANNADTVNAQLSITPAEEKVIAKPQVVATALKSRRDIQQYFVQEGDTVSSVAAKFSITSDSVRWSNGLTSDNLQVGKELTIPPINGIIYTVKEGDSPQSLATRFQVNKDQIIYFNDAEVAGLPVGEKIVIPDGVQPVARTYASFSWGGYAPMYGGNGYDYGWCTWWAAKRRAEIGRPIPTNLGNAITWKFLAQRAGLLVNGTPAYGAVAYYETVRGLGHVGFVEQVNPDGSFWISDMNYFGVSEIGGNNPAGGWGRRSFHLVQPSQISNYSFIH